MQPWTQAKILGFEFANLDSLFFEHERKLKKTYTYLFLKHSAILTSITLFRLPILLMNNFYRFFNLNFAVRFSGCRPRCQTILDILTIVIYLPV